MCDLYRHFPRDPYIEYRYVGSLADYSKLISEFTLDNSKKKEKEDASSLPRCYWFRGQASVDWPLWPSLYRTIHKENKDKGGLYKKYKKLKGRQDRVLSKFYARRSHAISKNRPTPGLPFPMAPDKKMHSLSIVQHYTENTCLLDWSHKGIAGLFFAIEKYFNDPQYRDKRLPCVWLLDPRNLNLIFQDNCNEVFNDLYNGLPTFYDIKPKEQAKYFKFPCAIIPPLHNDRILAQAGTFVTFPVDTNIKPKQDTCGDEKYLIRPLDTYISHSHKYLKCIVIWNPRQVANDYIKMGYDSIDFYPELSNKIQVLSEKWD